MGKLHDLMHESGANNGMIVHKPKASMLSLNHVIAYIVSMI